LSESHSELLQEANACFVEERWADAAAAFEQALSSQDGSAQDWYRLGVACLEMKLIPRALEMFRRTVSIDPSYGKAWNNIGVCQQQSGEQALAAVAYQRALDADSLLLPAVLNLAHLRLASDDAAQAAALLERATSLDPGSSTTWDTLARVRLRLGQTAAAEEAYRKAMELVSPKVLPHVKKAEAALLAGDYPGAEGALAAALEYIPDHPSLQHMLAAVRGQSSDRASAAYVRVLFDDYAATYDDAMRRRLQYRAPERLAELVVPVLKGSSPLRLVDLGCGTGFMGDALASLDAEIVGVDLSPKMLDLAAKRNRYAKLVQGDIVEELLRIPAGGIHAVVAADSLIYVGDLRPLFVAVKHALAGGGLFAFSVEVLEQGTFRLMPSGRYAHSSAYLRSLAQECSLAERALLPFQLRFERDRYIEGMLACFAAP